MSKLDDLQKTISKLKKPAEKAKAKPNSDSDKPNSVSKQVKSDSAKTQVKKPVAKNPAAKKPKPKSSAGRPTVMSDAVVNKLEEAFAMGCTDLEACFYADISRQTLYNYQESHPEFIDRKERLKRRPVLLARKVVVEALLDNDRASAHKVLERHDGTKTVLAGDADAPLEVITRIELVPAGGP